jgi:hypothetical protein
LCLVTWMYHVEAIACPENWSHPFPSCLCGSSWRGSLRAIFLCSRGDSGILLISHLPLWTKIAARLLRKVCCVISEKYVFWKSICLWWFKN